MSDPFIGEIRQFAGNFAPRGWAFCNGQILAIAQNQALFSLLGTTYGGDGRVTFALPDLRGRVPLHFSQAHPLGQAGGAETVTLAAAQMPAHTHAVPVGAGAADSTQPAGNLPATARVQTYAQGAPVPMGAGLDLAGGGQPHENMGPFLAVSFIIALEGIFPARN
jgi:microcystin-dependent protein